MRLQVQEISVISGVLLILCVNIILICYQLMIKSTPCFPGNDCHYYAVMTQAFITHQNITVVFPFNQRILLPFLVSLLPFHSISTSYSVINWVSINIALVMLIVVWARLKVPQLLIVWGLLWMLFNRAGIPFFFRDVVNTDVLGYVFNAVLIWIIIKRNYYYLILLAPLAVLQRESFLVSLFIIVIVEMVRFFDKKEKMPLVLSIFALILGIGANHLTNSGFFYPGEGSSLSTVFVWLKTRFEHPIMLLQWLCAIAMVVGGLPMLLKYFSRFTAKDTALMNLLLISLSFLGFGLVAGTDVTRIIFDGIPFIITACFYIAAQSMIDVRVIARVYLLSAFMLCLEYSLPLWVEYLTHQRQIYVYTLSIGFAYILTARLLRLKNQQALHQKVSYKN